MAAVTALTITSASPKGITITFTGGNDFNTVQVRQLGRILNQIAADMSEDSTMASVPVSIPTANPNTPGTGPASSLWNATGHI